MGAGFAAVTATWVPSGEILRYDGPFAVRLGKMLTAPLPSAWAANHVEDCLMSEPVPPPVTVVASFW